MEDHKIISSELINDRPKNQQNLSDESDIKKVERKSSISSNNSSKSRKNSDVQLSNEYYDKIVHKSIKRVSEFISQSDYSFRICVIGDANVGKTSLLTRYCDNVFKENYNNTIGVDFRVVSLKYKDILAKVHIWDTAGQERFKSISMNYFRSSHGFIFIYDITNKNSFNNINKWIDLAVSNNRISVVNFLVGNKNDMEENREVSVEEAKEFANLRRLFFLETSAKNNSNVEKAFEYLAFKLIDYYTRHKKDYRVEKDEDRITGEDIKTSAISDKKEKCKC